MILRFDHRVNASVVRGSDCDADSSQIAFRQAFSQLMPGRARVRALEQSTARAARPKIVRFTTHVPHGRIEHT